MYIYQVYCCIYNGVHMLGFHGNRREQQESKRAKAHLVRVFFFSKALAAHPPCVQTNYGVTNEAPSSITQNIWKLNLASPPRTKGNLARGVCVCMLVSVCLSLLLFCRGCYSWCHPGGDTIVVTSCRTRRAGPRGQGCSRPASLSPSRAAFDCSPTSTERGSSCCRASRTTGRGKSRW